MVRQVDTVRRTTDDGRFYARKPSQDFEGGVLTVAENEAYELDIGDAVFFPAPTLHTVAPITRGVRIVLAAWAQGPDFV